MLTGVVGSWCVARCWRGCWIAWGRRLAWFVLGWLVVLRFDGGGGCRFRVVGCVGFLVLVGCRWGGFSGWLLAVTGLAGVARGCCSRFRLGCLALDSGAERAGMVSTWFWLVVFCAGRFLWLAVGTSRRVAWFGAVLVWGGLLVPGVVGLRAVGSLPVPRRGLIAGVRVILVWLLVGGWWLVGARKLGGGGWWCSPGWLLDGWRSPVRATVGCCFPAPMVGGVPGVAVGVRVLGWLFFGWWWLASGCLMFPGVVCCWLVLVVGISWRVVRVGG